MWVSLHLLCAAWKIKPGGVHDGAHNLLIVDDNVAVLRGLARVCRLHFDLVLTAETPNEAEALLTGRQPPLLLCDYWLGYGHPPATTLIARWRVEYPFLKRVALMSGTHRSALVDCDDADVLFQKPLNITEVARFFKS